MAKQRLTSSVQSLDVVLANACPTAVCNGATYFLLFTFAYGDLRVVKGREEF